MRPGDGRPLADGAAADGRTWLHYLGRIGAVGRHYESMFRRVARHMQAPQSMLTDRLPWIEIGDGCRLARRLPPAE